MGSMDDGTSKRRRFLRVAVATGVATALAGCSSGGESTTTGSGDASGGDDATEITDDGEDQTGGADTTRNDDGDADTTTNGGGDEDTTTSGGNAVVDVAVGPGGDPVFDPEELRVAPGETVRWTWESDGHNVVADSSPDGADWTGTPGGADTVYDAGYVHEHTFETKGAYEYHCAPHESLGMAGVVEAFPDETTAGGGSETTERVVLGDDEPARVEVGPDGEFAFEPGTDVVPVVRPGTEVTFVWRSDNHTVTVDDQPGAANWTGTDGEVHESGFTHSHVFEVEGRYAYHCDPHVSVGMEGELVVESE